MTKWLQQYIMLVLRIGKVIRERTGEILYDYYGDRQLEEQIEKEELLSGEVLLFEALALAEDLPGQGFEEHRRLYLDKQLTALEMVCRRLCGAKSTLKEEAGRYFGLEVEWIPEAIFAEALSIYDKALPGRGDIRKRLARHRKKYELSRGKASLLPELMQQAVKETRRRTGKLIGLPEEEQTEILPITDKPVKAMAQYMGNYKSAIMVNTGLPFYLPELLSVVSHEGYPGHIAEIVLKEEYLIKRKGYLEQQVGFLLTPPFVISEGIALLAMQSVFDRGEAELWMNSNIYTGFGLEADSSDLLAIQKATDLLRGAWCNAALLLDEGRTVSEAVRYITKNTLHTEEQAGYAVKSLQRPFCEAYIFTYYYGRKLLEPILSGPQKQEKLKGLLTEQTCISDLL